MIASDPISPKRESSVSREIRGVQGSAEQQSLNEVPMATSKKKGEAKLNTFRAGPDDRGHFGIFGGRFVAETLMPLILDLEAAYDAAKADPSFQAELTDLLDNYGGRPSPLYFAERLT